jgi:hypothetical protein
MNKRFFEPSFQGVYQIGDVQACSVVVIGTSFETMVAGGASIKADTFGTASASK